MNQFLSQLFQKYKPFVFLLIDSALENRDITANHQAIQAFSDKYASRIWEKVIDLGSYGQFNIIKAYINSIENADWRWLSTALKGAAKKTT
jgi:hypothetical protein